MTMNPTDIASFLNGGMQIAWSSVLVFAGAIWLLSAMDIPLPRGDLVGVGGTLDSVALVVLGPLAAVISCVIGVVLALAVRTSSRGFADLVQTTVPRISGILAASVLMNPAGSLRSWTTWPVAFAAIVAYLITELVVAQLITSLRTRRSLMRLVLGNFDRLAPVIAAQLSTAMLAVVVYEQMSEWSLLLVVALLLLIRESYSLLLEIGETYRTTVEVLVQAAEGLGSDREGHAERTALIAREIAMGCGLAPRQVDRISYAALLHDISAISHGQHVISARPSSSSVLEGVAFFDDVVQVLRVCDGLSRTETSHPDDLLAAFIVALSSDVDGSIHTSAHSGDPQHAVDRVASIVPTSMKARAVAAAINLGYRIPAVA